MAGGKEECPLVDDLRELLRIDSDTIMAFQNNHFDFGLYGPLVCQGREVEFGADHSISARRIDRFRHRRQGGRRGREKSEFARGRSEECRHPASEVLDSTQPVSVPSGGSHVVPPLDKFTEIRFRAFRKGSERA